MSITNKHDVEYITSNLHLLDINETNRSEILEEYQLKLDEIREYFKFKCNVKSFNYIENNVIFKIFNLLNFKDFLAFSCVSKKYNRLSTIVRLSRIITLTNINQYKLIDNFKNILFHFDFRNFKKRLKSDVVKFKKIHSLNLPSYKNKIVSYLCDVNTLNLSCSYYIKDVSNLVNVKRLNLSSCYGVHDDNFQKLSDGDFDYLNLSCTNITNISKFVNVKEFILSGCYYLSNVYFNILSKSTKLEILNISGCRNVYDISMFVNLKVLNISTCINITQDHIDSFKKIFKGRLIY